MMKSFAALSIVIALIISAAPAQAAAPVSVLNASVAQLPDGGWVGSRNVNDTAVGQTIATQAVPGDVRQFAFAVTNSGNVSETPMVSGCGAASGFRVSYSIGGVNVTEQVQLGMFTFGELADGDSAEGLLVRVKVRPNAERRDRLNCFVTVASTRDAEARDTVQARVTVV